MTTGPKTLTSHTGEAGVEIGQEVLDGLERVLLAARSEEEALEDDDEGPVDSSDEEFTPKAKHTHTCVFQDDDSTDASDGDAMEA